MRVSRPVLNSVLTSLCPKGVLTLTIDNPTRKSALSREILTSLQAHFSNPPPAAKVVVLKSSDPRVFCSGHDINDFHRADASPSENKALHEGLFELCQLAMIAVKRCPIPTLAAVSGEEARGERLEDRKTN